MIIIMAWSFNAFNILGDFKAAIKVEVEKIVFLALPTDHLEVIGTDIQFQDRGRTKTVHAPACEYSVVVLPPSVTSVENETYVVLMDVIEELNDIERLPRRNIKDSVSGEPLLQIDDDLIEAFKHSSSEAGVIINGTNMQRFVLSNIEGLKYDVQRDGTMEFII